MAEIGQAKLGASPASGSVMIALPQLPRGLKCHRIVVRRGSPTTSHGNRKAVRLSGSLERGMLTPEVDDKALLPSSAISQISSRELVVAMRARHLAYGPRVSHESLSVLRGPRAEFPADVRIDDLVAQTAARYPDAVALRHGQEEVTYSELLERADTLRMELQTAGVRDGDIVPVRAGRNLDVFVMLFALLRCGAGYAFVPTDWPQSRFDAVVRITEAATVVHGVVPTQVRQGRPEDERVWAPSNQSAVFSIFLTSGTTGAPKAVLAPHRGVVRTAFDVARFGPPGTVLQHASPAWDVFALELWVTLIRGGTVVLANPDPLTGPTLRRYVAAGVDTLAMPTPVFSAVLSDDPDALRGVRLLYVGGDRLDLASVKTARGRLPDLRLVNAYGPVENTINTTLWPVDSDPEGDEVPIGTPTTNTDIYVLDEALRPLPAGRLGQLALAGDGLAFGYLGMPEETAAAFVEISDEGVSRRVYLSGDRGRVGPDGLLYFAGRMDRQVKVRGLRVECEEIERLVALTPGVTAVCVLALPLDAPVKTILATFYCADREVHSEIERRLSDMLPPGFKPDLVLSVPELPLTSNGKIDHRALAENFMRPTDMTRVTNPTEARAADSDTLALVLSVSRSLIGHEIPADQDLFDQGATSLTAMRLATRLARITGQEVSFANILHARTPQRIVEIINIAGESSVSESPCRTGLDHGFTPRILPWVFANFYAAARSGSRLDEAVVPILYELHGDLASDLPLDRLREALDALVRRHEVLRTRLAADFRNPEISVLPASAVGSLLIELPTFDDIATATHACQEWMYAPFDLAKHGPIRAGLARTVDGRSSLLALSVHHIFFDGWSARVFFDELAAMLSDNFPLADVSPGWSYYDVVAKHYADGRARLPGAIWSRRLQMADARVLTFPHAHEQIPWTGPVAEINLGIDHSLIHSMSHATAAIGGTATAVFLAAYVRVLHEYTGVADPAIAIPVTGRYNDAEITVIGCLADLTPIRIADCQDSRTLLTMAAEQLRIAMEPPTVPISTVMPKLQDGVARHPLLQAYLLQEELPEEELELGGVRAIRLRTPPRNAVPEITVELWPFPSIGGVLRYRVDAIPHSDAQEIAARFIHHARQLAAAYVTN